MSIFSEMFGSQPFSDRYSVESSDALTVIIPALHVNELWGANLTSIFREVPVFELLVGDAGLNDDALEVLGQFPRVRILNHRRYKTLGFSIRKLIEEVRTEHFLYVHSDVYLPNDWFDDMMAYRSKYDWYGCRMQEIVIHEFTNEYGERPYFGAQIGRTSIFSGAVSSIDDDFVYRQEEFVLSRLCSLSGGKEGRIDEAFHYHQNMPKTVSGHGPQLSSVRITTVTSEEEEIRIWESQAKGIVKYLEPDKSLLIRDAAFGFWLLKKRGRMTRKEIVSWINSTNDAWTPIVIRGMRIEEIRERLTQLQLGLKRTLKKIVR